MMLRWSTQRADDRYKDHLDGQLTKSAPARHSSAESALGFVYIYKMLSDAKHSVCDLH